MATPRRAWNRRPPDRGVYYGAGRSEAPRCSGDDVAVVGAGNSAGQAVLHLAHHGAHVVMVVRGERLGKNMSAYLVQRIERDPRIDVRLQTQVVEVHAGTRGTSSPSRSPTRRGRPSASRLERCSCASAACRTPAGPTRRTSDLSDSGYVLTGPDLLVNGSRPPGWPLDRDPLALETSVPGLFAAGDARNGSTKRVAGAVGEGSLAVALAHRRLEELAASS